MYVSFVEEVLLLEIIDLNIPYWIINNTYVPHCHNKDDHPVAEGMGGVVVVGVVHMHPWPFSE